jgi:hypothetical protein
MPRASKLRVLGVLVLFGSSACETYACQWTDEPFPDPVQTHQLEQRYLTDDGAFELVLHADGEWPLVAGTTSLRIEATEPEQEQIRPNLFVDRPYIYGGELVAPAEPVVVEVRPGEWQIDALVLEAEGIWALPVWLEQGEIDDSIEIYVEVVDDDG